jgi:hypothetical protein
MLRKQTKHFTRSSRSLTRELKRKICEERQKHRTLGCNDRYHIAHLPQQCHNSKFVIFQGKVLKVLKCYNFLWVQRRHNCSPAASFADCVMTLHLLKVHLQTFISIPITKKCQILSCNTLVANECYIVTCSIIMWFYEAVISQLSALCLLF